jgi:hypothetical protein
MIMQAAIQNRRDLDTVLAEWKQAASVAKNAAELESALRDELVRIAFDPSLTEEGTKRIPLDDDFDLKAVFKQNYNLANRDAVDEALTKIEALGNEGKFIAERVVTYSPKLSLSEYRELAPQYKRIIDEVLTVTPGKPAVEIVSRGRKAR